MKKIGIILLTVATVAVCLMILPPFGHLKQTIPAVAVTCVESGLTEGLKCSLCGKTLITQEVIPATGVHNYDTDYDDACNTCPVTREVPYEFAFVDGRVVLVDEDETHENLRAIVYKLGSQRVDDLRDEAAMKAIDTTAKTHWGIKNINKIQLDEPGNYVVMLLYNKGSGAAKRVPLAVSVTEE